MAVIPFPAAAVITGMTLQQLYLGDTTHRSAYTGAQQTLARAPGRWTGSLEVAITDSDADRRAVEAWLIALRGTINVTEIPLAGRDGPATAPEGVWAATTAVATAGVERTDPRNRNDDRSLWLALQSSDGLPDTGDYVRVASRVYSVQESAAAIPWITTEASLSQPGIRVLPGVFPATDEASPRVLRTGVTVRAQVLDEAPSLPLDGDYAGPWSFQWIEVP